MTKLAASDRAGSRAPEREDRLRIKVISSAGSLVRKVMPEDAQRIVQAGLGYLSGRGNGMYVQLTAEAPFRGGVLSLTTTHPLRADSTCKHYGPGQLMGNSRLIREHNSLN